MFGQVVQFLAAYHAVLLFRPLNAIRYFSGAWLPRGGMIFVSVLADAFLQIIAGPQGPFAGISVALGAVVLFVLPPKLSAAAATITPAQLLPGILIYGYVPLWGQYALWTVLPGLLLQFAAAAAFVWLVLTYIRTPKEKMAQ